MPVPMRRRHGDLVCSSSLLPTQRRKWKRDSLSTRGKGSAFLITFPGGGGGGYLTNVFHLEIVDILFIV